jgi:hypothetical protein
MHWTVGHLEDLGANLDIVIGDWGDDSDPDSRVAVSLVHYETSAGPQMTVIDAEGRRDRLSGLAHRMAARDAVIGTPLAAQVFLLVDAIYLQDGRFF